MKQVANNLYRITIPVIFFVLVNLINSTPQIFCSNDPEDPDTIEFNILTRDNHLPETDIFDTEEETEDQKKNVSRLVPDGIESTTIASMIEFKIIGHLMSRQELLLITHLDLPPPAIA